MKRSRSFVHASGAYPYSRAYKMKAARLYAVFIELLASMTDKHLARVFAHWRRELKAPLRTIREIRGAIAWHKQSRFQTAETKFYQVCEAVQRS